MLIPLLPLFAALSLALGERRLGECGHRIGIPAISLSFGLSIWAFLEVLKNGPISLPLYRLFQAGSLVVDLSLYIDQLTVLLLLLVTGVSTVVHVYSSRYMIGDPRYNRFFAVIALFTFSMLMVVMSNNLLMLFAFWEIMGLCSYLLISHWSQRKPAIQAATKAFLVNAIADVGLGFGIILTFSTFGTLDIQTILSQAESMQDHTVNLLGWLGLDLHVRAVTIIPFFFFMGVMGKSAQLPFHVWLPFAMEAPTPVSALIHAATMVNAGPFLLVRLSPLLVLSPMAMTFIAVIGGLTALFAAIVSMTQSDIKKNLAYSTMSQIGFMIMACGIGAFVAAIFHLLAHGFLKAFLFLSTGNALQSHHHAERGHGASPQPKTLLYVMALVLACLPPFIIFSGPYEAVWMAHGFSLTRIVFWGIGLTTVFFTAIYLFRGICSLFNQSLMVRDELTGELKPVTPQIVSPSHLWVLLAGGGVMVAMLLGVWTWFVQFLTPALALPSSLALGVETPTNSMWWIVLPLGVAIGGWAYAVSQQGTPQNSIIKESALRKTLYVVFLNKGYFDELYEAFIVQPTLRLAHWLWWVVDVRGIDAAIHTIASSSMLLAQWLWKIVDIKGIDRVVVGIGQQSVGLGRWLWNVVDVRWLENNFGQVGKRADAAGQFLRETENRTIQHYLLVMVLWLVSAIALLYILV